MKTHWKREEPQFFNIYALDWEEGSGPRMAHGVESRTISRGADTGAETLMLRLPPGYRYVEPADEGTLEIFVLEGDLSCNGQTVGAGGFVAVPKGRGPAELSSTRGAQLFLFWDPALVVDFYYEGTTRVTRTWKEPWVTTEMPELRHGIMHKSLRYPDPADGLVHGGPGGMLRFILMTPGFGETRQEVHHDCWEEIIFLSGDFLMPDRGLHGPGTLLGNPAELPHGGLTTQKGCVMLLHCNAPMGADFVERENGRAIVDTYLDTASWIAPDEHRDWADLPEYHITQRDPSRA